jgi:hypothetical protein
MSRAKAPCGIRAGHETRDLLGNLELMDLLPRESRDSDIHFRWFTLSGMCAAATTRPSAFVTTNILVVESIARLLRVSTALHVEKHATIARVRQSNRVAVVRIEESVNGSTVLLHLPDLIVQLLGKVCHCQSCRRLSLRRNRVRHDPLRPVIVSWVAEPHDNSCRCPRGEEEGTACWLQAIECHKSSFADLRLEGRPGF